jgi:hypothetical protein
MDAFAITINGWHDFYILIGTASATLLGLLFVSLSLNADAISHPTNKDLRALAEQSFSNFIFVLSYAIIFLIPNQDQMGLGLPLLGVGGTGLGITLAHYLRTRTTLPRVWKGSNITRRFIAPAICHLVLIITAVNLMFGVTSGLNWLVPVMIVLIIVSSINAWDLLLRLREPNPEPRVELKGDHLEKPANPNPKRAH